MMKRIKLIIYEPSINKVIGRELNLVLDDQASLIDAINEVDKIINGKGSFPVPDFQSLLHMIYNPVENRFYKQVALRAHAESDLRLNLRDDPRRELPEGTTVILIPAGGCISEWEEVIDYERFLKAI
jgi:hypothetical protein